MGVRGVRIARVGGSVDAGLARWLEGLMMGPKEEERIEEVCACDSEWRGAREVLCGKCYRKPSVLSMDRSLGMAAMQLHSWGTLSA